MVEVQQPPSRDPIITSFGPIFRKNLERLEQRGLNQSNEASNLRRALKRIEDANEIVHQISPQ